MSGTLRIAFGKRRVPGTVPGTLAPGHAVISAQTAAIRLNSPGWLRPPPELIAALDDRAALRLLCRDGLKALTGGFSAAAHRAIGRYLDHLDAAFPLPEAPSVRLFDASDRFFAALLPMPEPRIACDNSTDPAQADLAFWDGKRLTLIRFGGPERETPQVRRALEGLQADAPVPVRLLHAPEQRDAPISDILPEDVLQVAASAPPPLHGPIRLTGFQVAADLEPVL